jgi:hypothetical protein
MTKRELIQVLAKVPDGIQTFAQSLLSEVRGVSNHELAAIRPTGAAEEGSPRGHLLSITQPRGKKKQHRDFKVAHLEEPSVIAMTVKPPSHFRSRCENEQPPVEDGLKLCRLIEGEGGSEQWSRALRCFRQAVRVGRVPIVRWPELRDLFPRDLAPHVSAGLVTLIDAAIKLNAPFATRRGYAKNLAILAEMNPRPARHMDWVPFLCRIGHQMRALMKTVGPCPDGGDDRVIFVTLREVLDFATTGPPDEHDGPDD